MRGEETATVLPQPVGTTEEAGTSVVAMVTTDLDLQPGEMSAGRAARNVIK